VPVRRRDALRCILVCHAATVGQRCAMLTASCRCEIPITSASPARTPVHPHPLW
jgi:hypothetical protein